MCLSNEVRAVWWDGWVDDKDDVGRAEAHEAF